MFVDFDVVIAQSFAQVETWRKRHADACGMGVFAQSVTTFDAWISDLWELHGDGRAIVDDMQRRIALQAMFATRNQEPVASGIVQLAASCIRKAAGMPAFEEVLDSARNGAAIPGLSAREVSFLHVLAQYEDFLARLGLIEPGFAAMELARRADTVFPRPLNVLMSEAAPLSWVQDEFFTACSQLDLTVEPASGATGIGPAPDGVNVRFAFPSGRLAEPGLVADIVLECAQEGDVVVVCKDPLDMCLRTEQRLSVAGLKVCVQTRKPFATTDFGKAFLTMFHCLHDNPWDPATLTDVVLSPFAGFSQARAFEIDKSIRADRIAKREDVISFLRAQSEPFSQLEELASDPEADVLIGAFEQAVQAAVHRPAAWRSEQLSVMGALREAMTTARVFGADIDAFAATLEKASVSVPMQTGGAGASVLFTTQAFAARMGNRTVASLVIADLTAEDYPVADKDDAMGTLFAKLGFPSEESALSRARRQFCALCSLPSRILVVMRPLGDANADATYPSAVLEEFVDAYRSDASATDDIDNAYRLPEALQDNMAERGEQFLFANAHAAAVGETQCVEASVPMPRIADVGGLGLVETQSYGSVKRLSPSQIESFLECPLQWFVSRRLRVETLDEEFGALAKGSFAHAALESFYRQFQAAGYAKVTEQNLPAARELMRGIAEKLAEAQFAEEPGNGRLVYVTELERREVAALCDQVVSYLDFEAKLLPTFHPAHFEYVIDADRMAEYAGFPIVGKVDRIDVDDSGHAVIIDYKSSLNGEYEIAGKTADHAGKVQTRIYAKVVEEELGLDVVGALYVNCVGNPAVSGAYDSRVLDAVHLPGIRPDKCACGLAEQPPANHEVPYMLADLTFDAMLDETERIVASAIARMGSGEIEPDPAFQKVCEYCPVLSCPKRGA